jgi:hypothetical protein
MWSPQWQRLFKELPNTATLLRRTGLHDTKVAGNKGIQMPRKKQTDKTPLEEPTISDTTDISEPEERLSATGISQEEPEAIPFAEIIAEMESDDEKVNVPHFADADAAHISTPALDHDALDKAIQEARAHAQPEQDEPAHSPVIAHEQPALMAIQRREVFAPEIAPPPPVFLAAAVIILICLLAFR